MTDGPSLPMNHRLMISNSPASSINRDALDLRNFSEWIALQPVSTHVTLLDLIANDLYRRRDFPTLAGAIKSTAKDLRTFARHEAHAEERP